MSASHSLPVVVFELSKSLREVFESRRGSRDGNKARMKKRKLSPKVISNLSLEIWLVAIGCRTAHLIDSFQAELSDCQDICRALKQVETLSHLIVLVDSRSGQTFVVNSELLSRIDLEGDQNDRSRRRRYIDVREGSEAAKVLDGPPSNLYRILEGLLYFSKQRTAYLSPQVISLDYKGTFSSEASIGVAGYLLDYPSIYLLDVEMDQEAEFELRMVEDEKILEDHDAEQNFTEPLRNNLGGQDLVLFQSFLSIEDFQHPLSSFTTPKACLSSAETDKMSSDMESQLKKRLDLALEKIERGPKSQGEVELGDWIRKMTPNVKTSVVNLSSIAL